MPWHTVLEFLLHTTTKIGAIFMENTTTNPDVLERFLRYVQINTQSEDANCDQVPSSAVQFDLANVLAEELRELGAEDAHVTEHAYVCAHIPASAGAEDKPALGLIAHLDTTEVAPGAGVKPYIVHYEGGDLVCGTVDGKPVAMSTAKLPALNDLAGEDLVCSDGTTLLGADDKAGVAEIMSLVARIAQDPSLPHPALGICFCPDEEIGHGAELLDIDTFGCKYAYTVDGGMEGELEYENFNAASAKIDIQGRNVHPGYAKNKMVNALDVACELQGLLPAAERPQYTEGYEGFYHCVGLNGTVEKASVSYIIRDHDAEKFEQKKVFMWACVDLLKKKYGDGVLTLTLKDQYFNMRKMVEPHPQVIDKALKAMEMAGVNPIVRPIRGGTDGARLSFMGLPCPNLFTGGMNFHGKFEYCSLTTMHKTEQVILNLAQLWAE
mgnify:CR=1 FL=1